VRGLGSDHAGTQPGEVFRRQTTKIFALALDIGLVGPNPGEFFDFKICGDEKGLAVFRGLGNGEIGLAVGFGDIRAEVTDHGGQQAHGNSPETLVVIVSGYLPEPSNW
jgi:hypothetical protein